jgi:hypothetical protein
MIAVGRREHFFDILRLGSMEPHEGVVHGKADDLIDAQAT